MNESDRYILDVQDMHAYYGDQHVLDGVSMNVLDGEVMVILGTSGMRKIDPPEEYYPPVYAC